ncbi:hypothetical protein AV530_015641 [Patagioenas fasciata monilis]|uniref:Uncharacterized protein n=1 Tax=Patagioenas fasciata monilis TaxID=372326 RepID=A0A1V4KIB1_PATFA|nr:hypothetical protein AV530_015641 [Patagioenas fasciata monilis]
MCKFERSEEKLCKGNKERQVQTPTAAPEKRGNMLMAQESCLTDSLKGIICSGKMTFCIFSRTRLTARNLFGAEGGVRHWLKCSLQSDTAEEENQVLVL